MHRSLRNSLSLALCLCLIVASTAAFALVGTDTLPGDVCTAGEKDYSRMTADPDHDGASLVLYCDGSHWLAMTGGATTLDALTDVFTDYTTNHNVIGGRASAAALTSGAWNNTFWGEGAGATSANSTSATDENTAFGYNALTSLTSGSTNVGIGAFSLNLITTGSANTAVGDNSGASITGFNNTAIGKAAIYGGTAAGNDNTAVGANALYNVTGGQNVALGMTAGDSITSGNKNIVIGNDVDTSAAGASNELNIGNTLYGTGIIDGTVRRIGINVPAPVAGLDVGTDLALSGDITPTTLAANTNNWAPSGLSGASVIRASASGAYNLTGLTGGADGRVITIFNVGTTNAITLKNQSTSSTSGNRFAISSDMIIQPDQSVSLIYDATSQRWRSASIPFSSSTYALTGIDPASLYDFEGGVLSPFQTGGNADWTASTTSPYAGTYSAQSGSITHSQETWISLTVTLSSPKTLTFYYKTSTETGCGTGWCDVLHFYVDNDTKDTWSGTVAWTQSPSYSLTAGTHVLKWQYIRDSSGGSGSNAVWIDNIQFN